MNIKIKPVTLSVIIILGLLFQLCEKDISITEFSDDFDDYEPELRIEAIFDPVEPMNSIVRIDRSIRIDDVTAFNGKDDDGDWVGYSDLNGNGKWDKDEPLNDDLGEDGIEGQDNGFPRRDDGEADGKPNQGEPHVDEYDEILPFIQDSTAQVYLKHLQTGDIFRFIWTEKADSFQISGSGNPFGNEDEKIEIVTYSAYKPDSSVNFQLVCNCEYEFTVISEHFDLTITGTTIPMPPVHFVDSTFASISNQDTLRKLYGTYDGIFWQSDPLTSTYYIKMEQIHSADSIEIVYTHPSFPIEVLTNLNDGIPIGFENISPTLLPGLYRFTVGAMDPYYGRYYYSSLSLKDPEKSNLRDQYGNAVMGVAGSIAYNHIYVRIK